MPERSTASSRAGRRGGVLPSWLLGPTLVACVWVTVAPFVIGELSATERFGLGPLPAAVAGGFALASWLLWLHHAKPWHDWVVIVLLLPAIAAAVWVAVGSLALDVGLSSTETLGISVGPGIALVGLLTTAISFQGRHHPDPTRDGYRYGQR